MRLLWLALAVVAMAASAAGTEQRPPLKGVSAVRIANYGAPSTVLKSRDEVRAIVGDLNELRKNQWHRGETKLSCYSTIVLLSGEKTVGLFRVGAEYVVERPVEKGESSYSIALDRADLPNLRKHLAEIPPAKCQ
jgi:hypothetical protein